MPRAIILLDWDRIKGPVIRAKYPEIDFDLDLPMKIFMTHTAQEPVETQLALQFGNANIASRLAQFEERGIMRRILFIFLLNSEENPRDYFETLEELEATLINEIDASYLPELLKNFYLQKTSGEILTEFNAEQLSAKLINRSKQLLDAGEIQKAQILISRAKGYPQQIAESLQLAETALNEKKYVIAGTHYETASNLLLEIDETTLMQQYAEKAEKLKKIPILQKERKEYIESALKALKKVDFSEAIEWFNAAAIKSQELEDEVKVKEYSVKAKALTAFLEAERQGRLQETSEDEE